MCGINLFIDGENKADESLIHRMNSATQHRGPDASKFSKYTINRHTIYIGNNRLKITDPSDEANLPFLSTDGRYCLSFNGEIYNYQALRKNLENEFHFRTQSDSEVLLYHLIKYGAEGIAKLNGMFAFIFYNTQTGKTLIVRDRHGIKPVYFFSNAQHFICSSEIKGILASGLVKKELNHEQIPYYLWYKHAQYPATFYKNIFELPPGHLLETTGTQFTKRQWFSELPSPIESSSSNDSSLVQHVGKLLEQAIALQWADLSTKNLFLSGGVDSTLLLALSKKLGYEGINGFTIVNSGKDKNFGTADFIYAKKAASQYGSTLHELEVNDEVLKIAPGLLADSDQPIGDSAMLLTHLLCKKIGATDRTVLSGAGADEWFAGYNRHYAYEYYLHHYYGHPIRQKLTRAIGTQLPDGNDFWGRKIARLVKKFSTSIHASPIETMHDMRSMQLSFFNYSSSNSKLLPTVDSLLELDRSRYLVSDILMLTDYVSMKQHVEVRVPFLDNELTQYAATLPAKVLLKNGKKWILKQLLIQQNGLVYTKRNKEGFGMPVGKWIQNPKNSYILEPLLNKNNPLYEHISYDKVKSIVYAHQGNKKDYSSELWALITLAYWIEHNF